MNKNMLLEKISNEISTHEMKRMEQLKKVQMKATSDIQKVEQVKMRNSPNKENKAMMMNEEETTMEQSNVDHDGDMQMN